MRQKVQHTLWQGYFFYENMKNNLVIILPTLHYGFNYCYWKNKQKRRNKQRHSNEHGSTKMDWSKFLQKICMLNQT